MTHAMGAMRELHLGKVLSTEDDESRGRIEVELITTGLTLWASCITPGSGSGYGVSCLPRTGEIVVLAFLGPDEDNAFVLGAVWAGDSSQPEDARPVDDIYAITTPEGCKILINDAEGPKINIETPSGAHMTITDDGGGITLELGQETVTLTEGSISVSSSSTAAEVSTAGINSSSSTVSWAKEANAANNMASMNPVPNTCRR